LKLFYQNTIFIEFYIKKRKLINMVREVILILTLLERKNEKSDPYERSCLEK